MRVCVAYLVEGDEHDLGAEDEIGAHRSENELALVSRAVWICACEGQASAGRGQGSSEQLLLGRACVCETRQTEKQTPSSAITHTVKITEVPAVCTMLMSPELLPSEWNHEQKVESRYQHRSFEKKRSASTDMNASRTIPDGERTWPHPVRCRT